MTVDQTGAIAIFEGLGFKAEALLRDHVRDKTGKKHDIVVLGHNVVASPGADGSLRPPGGRPALAVQAEPNPRLPRLITNS